MKNYKKNENLNKKKMLSIKELASFCKKKGIIFPSSEIYGGFKGFWDYGPIGVEIKRNLENALWNFFVSQRDDVNAVDGSIITHPKVWVASGHADGFSDPLTDCSKCKKRYRADHLLEKFTEDNLDSFNNKQLNEMMKKHEIKCETCKTPLGEVRNFNLMFKSNVGAVKSEDSEAFLRPETAQTIFTNVKNVLDTTRLKPPFGIAQLGKAFRNEISPRNFLFRCREFTQFEIEFLNNSNKIPKEYSNEIKDFEILEFNVKIENKTVKKTLKELVTQKLISSKWIMYWILQEIKFFKSINIDLENIRLRRHDETELSHYSSETWDIEHLFDNSYKEIIGIADRSDFDLKQQQKHSGTNLTYYDEETKKRILLKTVSEPSIGVDRLFLSVLINAHTIDEKNNRTVLKISPKLSAYKVAVFPLTKEKELINIAKKIHKELKSELTSYYDEKGSIGKRYRRQDEIGTPYCLTIDSQTIEDKKVTVRDRNTLKQERIEISELSNHLMGKIKI